MRVTACLGFHNTVYNIIDLFLICYVEDVCSWCGLTDRLNYERCELCF